MYHFENTKLYLGDQFELNQIPKSWSQVHIGSKFFPDKITKIAYINRNQAYLKWEDVSDSSVFGIKELIIILDFLENNKDNDTFLHCEYGQSRSPAMAMVYLTKRLHYFPDNFYTAVDKFAAQYPSFVYPSGITKFLKENWKEIM